MGNVCAVGTGGTVDERRRDKGRWVQVRRRERNGTEGTEGRGAVGAGAWDSAGNACAAYVGEWGASLAAGELWAMCERWVQVRTGGGVRHSKTSASAGAVPHRVRRT